MERRQLLAASGLAFVPFGSCLGTGADDERDRSSDEPDAWPPDIAATEPVLSAGERAPLTVAIEDAAGAIVSPPSETDAIEFAFADADLAPSSASTYPGSPPVWRWDARTAVEIDLPVTAAPDTAAPREYEYRVTALDAEPDFEARDEHSNTSERGDAAGATRISESFSISIAVI